MIFNSPFAKTLYIYLPPLSLWSSLSELSEVLSPGLQSSFCPNNIYLATLMLCISFSQQELACAHLPPPPSLLPRVGAGGGLLFLVRLDSVRLAVC